MQSVDGDLPVERQLGDSLPEEAACVFGKEAVRGGCQVDVTAPAGAFGGD